MKSKLKEAIGRRIAERGNGHRAAASSERVEALVADNSPLEAIDVLTRVNREHGEPEIERRLVRVRHEAFAELGGSSAPPADASDEDSVAAWTLEDGLPAVPADALDARAVRSALLQRGSLLVRGLIPPDRAAALVEGLDRAFAARDRHMGGAPAAETTPWFEPFDPGPHYPDFSLDAPNWNRLKRGGGTVWAPDSPRMLFELLEAFAEVGLPALIAEYLGERPVLSLHKSVLRRVSPQTGTDWHQDGAFLGEGIRTLNVWIALSSCGDDAPGIDVVPKRLELVETGTEGAYFPWTVSPTLVNELMDGETPPRPRFEPGDALLFDHLCLHRTGVEPRMTKDRYASETWCFAPSVYPGKPVPLVL
jgi:hypothetical protein